MPIRFTADELLAIAERIESNAVTFYQTAAAEVSDADATGLLMKLAAWEMDHQDTFAAVRRELTAREREPAAFDPDNEAALYLQAVADGVVFDPHEDPARILGVHPTLQHILDAALAREKESVVFYTGMRAMVPARLGHDRLERIIQEELGHIAALLNNFASAQR